MYSGLHSETCQAPPLNTGYSPHRSEKSIQSVQLAVKPSKSSSLINIAPKETSPSQTSSSLVAVGHHLDVLVFVVVVINALAPDGLGLGTRTGKNGKAVARVAEGKSHDGCHDHGSF